MNDTNVYVLVGARFKDADLVKSGVDLATSKNFHQCPALCNYMLIRNPRSDGWSYLCTMHKSMSEKANDVLTVIYQDENWFKYEVMNVLQPLGLWEDGQFGVWVLPVWSSK